jgi:uncharacterized protein (TIGR02270 family)
MATSIRDFNIGLYREHLEEASFLYEQRLAYLHDPEVKWPDLKAWEERFEAHLDALMVGGALAMEVCQRQAAEGDSGELHTALRVFCREGRKDEAFAVLRALDPSNDEAMRAASEALRCEAPREWVDELMRSVPSGKASLAPLLAQVIGFRRFACEPFLKDTLTTKPPIGLSNIAWALGRVGTTGSAPALWSLLDNEDGRVCEAAAIALMRLGDERPVQRAMLAALEHSWARRVLAIGGDSRAARILLDGLKRKPVDAGAVLALGLLGSLSAVYPLVDLLDDDELGEPAAVSLNTILGAGLYAAVFIPDKVDPDELSSDEREAYDKDGKVPMRHGKPFGNWERRPVRDKDSWHAWLEREKSRFDRELRWRMGRPYGPSALVECLQSEMTPYAVRSATYEELVVRFGLDVPFEVDLPVSQQMRFLKKIETWVARQPDTFAEGRYYFAGSLQG